MCRTVYDLTREELNELKDSYFWSDDPDVQEILEESGIDYSWQIPDDVIFHNYEGIAFVEEDFWCNI